ncbi:tyrosine kinase-like protein [Babesia caballi]|uniref:Tyrosine kinase-like protein n=1 Tax=Babesia caballi TaxID=5871 RepID=A0AAV4LMP5_BABCB|nr:tyrosine kinase-like protein [Babesia caballi]
MSTPKRGHNGAAADDSAGDATRSSSLPDEGGSQFATGSLRIESTSSAGHVGATPGGNSFGVLSFDPRLELPIPADPLPDDPEPPDANANDVCRVTPKRHDGAADCSLIFLNVKDKREQFAVPQEYPYKQGNPNDDASFAAMVYPLLPKLVKTPRRTLVPFSGATSADCDRRVFERLDAEVERRVRRAIGGAARDVDPPGHEEDPIFSADAAKRRRHYLFAKQWKRNAINDCLFKFYQSKFGGREDASLTWNAKESLGGNEALLNFVALRCNPPNHPPPSTDGAVVKDWISAGPAYSKALSDAFARYHDFLSKRRKTSNEVKRRVAATSRYFFEILAEAKECERKMHERELVTEERLYGRRDFIAEADRASQYNKNKQRKLYNLCLHYQKKCEDILRSLRGDRSPLPPAYAQHAIPGSARDSSSSDRQVHTSEGVTEVTTANLVSGAERAYGMSQCNTTAPATESGTASQDGHSGELTQIAPRLTQDNDSSSSELVASSCIGNTVYLADRDSGGELAGAAAATPGRVFGPPLPRDPAPNSGRVLLAGALESVSSNTQRGPPQTVSVGAAIPAQLGSEMMTPPPRVPERPCPAASNEGRPASRPTEALEPDPGGPVTPTLAVNSASARDLQPSSRLASAGGVNRWIYNKMEERGELEGYRALLAELNELLFAQGATVLGYGSLPQAFDWLDETDANRAIIPPSQETFRDGTLYTTCSFAEIKLMKVLQGGICALRSRPRSRELDQLVLQQILDVNNELVELKKKLDNGRFTLFKKLKRDWAERNSKWAGFPPLKRGYRLLNMLGKGGFAEVWEVLDPITLTVQAAKLHILSHEMNSVEREKVVMRVKNEIDIHKTCRAHKNIVNMKACFEMGDNMLATILELCDDGDLDHYIKLHAPVPEKLALTWTYQILEGLHYMKTLPEGRVHHCDLKPGNILKHKGNVKLADFGLSKVTLRPVSFARRPQMVPHESTVELWGGGGTIYYQPPECLLANFRNKQVLINDKIDIWAVGCILYEMLYNSRPFGFVGGRPSPSERMYNAILGGLKFPPGCKVSEPCKVRQAAPLFTPRRN